MRSGKCWAFSRFLISISEEAVMTRMVVVVTVPRPQSRKSHPTLCLGGGGAGQLAEMLVMVHCLFPWLLY